MAFLEVVNFLNQNSGALQAVFAGIVMLATVVYACLTAQLVAETKRMREVQTEPKIEITASPREEFVNIITLRIENIGLGSAYNIGFVLSGLSNSTGEGQLIEDFSKSQFLAKGLRYLGPRQILHSGFTQITENFEEKIKARLNIEVTYNNATGKTYKDTIPILFEEFDGYGSIGKPNLYAIAQSLEKIQKNFEHLISGFKRLKVDNFTSEDRYKDEEGRKKWVSEQNSNKV